MSQGQNILKFRILSKEKYSVVPLAQSVKEEGGEEGTTMKFIKKPNEIRKTEMAETRGKDD